MTSFKRNPLALAVSAALTGSVLVTAASLPAHAQGNVLEEITVTAQKRTENLQDVAVSVQVLGAVQLEQLNINGFEDYIEFLPTVSYTSNGPGYGILYMRGISSGGDGVHSGSMPSVGVYLDEQPVTTIGQVLDVHIYDVARIETLAGPQG
ncbi:MAG: Plug domain-containing protein, partial [Woeseia sp.]